MDRSYIFAHVDHTLLKPTATLSQIFALCEEAVTYQTASVCIPPRFLKAVKERFGDALTLCTVIGFPLGYQTTAVKVAETRDAVENGADEIDMVIALGDVKDGNFDAVTSEIKAVKEACGGKLLKVIIETCYLTEDEKITLCHCVSDSGADFIKTSTGFGTNGATLDDIALFKAHIADGVKIKAAGGIRTKEDMISYLQAGCDRIGTSGAVAALGGE
ncbi:MAG: deoxyribose-phosphate aldolase [Ruminococcaceae bacterium]|nr:deoxyribose-phosphate aldolase [Oscillospiraceae bacterium]